MNRGAMLQTLIERLADAPSPLIAVDGPDAAGKTTLADELAARLANDRRPVTRVSLDRFHRPASERYARGRLSPEGYVDDSFDLDALQRDVLAPLGNGGSRQIVRERFDWQRDDPVTSAVVVVPPEACVVIDGVFLHRRELAPHWTTSVFVFARADVVLTRARARDAELLGGQEEVERRYLSRYLRGQALYFERDRPHERATVCIENSDPENPVVSPELVATGVNDWIVEHRRP